MAKLFKALLLLPILLPPYSSYAKEQNFSVLNRGLLDYGSATERNDLNGNNVKRQAYIKLHMDAYEIISGEDGLFTRSDVKAEKDRLYTQSLENQNEFLKQLDNNNDNVISSEEIQSGSVLTRAVKFCMGRPCEQPPPYTKFTEHSYYPAFMNLDANKDGSLSWDERQQLADIFIPERRGTTARYHKILLQYEALIPQDKNSLTRINLQDLLNQTFTKYDIDHNDEISFKELSKFFEIYPCRTDEEIEKEFNGDTSEYYNCTYDGSEFNKLILERPSTK